MPRIFSNNAVATTSSAITSASTTIALATGQGAKFPTPSGSDYFIATLATVSGVTETSWEIVKVTARSGDSLTVVRAQEGTTAAAWPAGSTLEHRLTAETLAGFLQNTGGSLNDGVLTMAMFKDCGLSFFNSGTTNALDYINGSCQRWFPSGSVSLSVSNWPASGNLGQLLIEGVNLGAATITWPTINWVKSDGITTTTFASSGVTLQTAGTDWVLLWSRDGGTTIYGKVVR
ncbi:hypothetical protein B9Z51_08630 [Limnohabitans sp. T6-5]|uniref:hypothetical protein n=1 Tax=Limnohabitans sp. T6-5 TaxID=1100724 RepID=UPI000D3C1C92|nr:hypothetical protein [Limnohabitans sp. T6-5]PUE08989.1 hypothetical protein B9Z51_08630 [Limnohabitans sp. T6-5]